MTTDARDTDCARILAFYSDTGLDHRGRSIRQVLAFTTRELEDVHDYIQWLFPLDTRSAFNTSAPLLSRECQARFREDDARVARLHQALDVMLAFYGFTRRANDIVKSDQHERRTREWVTPGNHNFLRLTRILRSLTLLGEPALARALLAALEALHAEHAAVIGATTPRFWRGAVQGLA